MTFLGLGLVGLLALGVWIFTLIDVLVTPAAEVRHLQKVLWFLIVLLVLPGFEIIGIVLWFVFGRPRVSVPAGQAPLGRVRPGTRGPANRGPQRGVGPDDDIEFLRGLNRKPDGPN
jgi:hypothetical protein